ncbi:hypothetical protein GCM10011586_34810 [Silvibacterium dinghuense]|nr:hypothetical protein GCM10011586_34810 [Silvibacterium dinghuense]
MAGSGDPQIGDFTLHPQVLEAALHFGAQLGGQAAYLPDSPLWRLSLFEAESELRSAAALLFRYSHDFPVYMRSPCVKHSAQRRYRRKRDSR